MSVLLLIISSVYMLAGFSAFVAFLVLVNYPACLWAFATGIISSISTHLHCLNVRKKLDDWYSENELHQLVWAGFICFTIGSMGFVYHLAIQLMLSIPILPIEKSEILPVVWSFMTMKSGLFLMFHAKKYRDKNVPVERSNLFDSDEPETADMIED